MKTDLQTPPCSLLKLLIRPSFLLAVVSIPFTLMFTAISSFSEVRDGMVIMEQVYAKEQATTFSATVEMILIGNDGGQRSREMKMYTRHYEDVTKRVVFILDPPDVRGTALLTYDYPSADQQDEQWMYLPALHRTKRISAGNRSGSFMGSDFSYGDMTQKSLQSHTYRLLQERQDGDAALWVIEALPIDEETAALYGYSRSLLLVRQDNFVITGAVHWLIASDVLKYFEVTSLIEIDGIWVPLQVKARTVSKGKTVHQTILNSKDIELNRPVDEELFTRRRLALGF
ncbi:MAG: outer membrane lipoprotein-sorting protein [Desulfopila sp.]|jgi:hypothetical protein|nr:outer membrane lipoprotein-sorting protein [Desulfopila sp.]